MTRGQRVGGALIVAASLLPIGAAEVVQVTRAPTVHLSPCVSPDNGLPDLISTSLTPAEVDVRHRAATVTVRLVAEDEGGPGRPSGIASVEVGVAFAAVHLVKADDGSWHGALSVPVGSAPGDRPLNYVRIQDNAGHLLAYQEKDLVEVGMARSVSVVSTPDSSLPVLRDLHLSTTSVDARQKTQLVHISARATDDTGVTYVAVSPVTRTGHASAQLHRVSGTARDGRWVGVLKVQKWLGTARWNLQVHVDDVRNTTSYSAKRLSGLHLPSTLFVRSRSDVTKPRVVSATASEQEVDVSTQDGLVVITVHATDIGSGIRSVNTDVRDRDGHTLAMARVAGTSNRGTWRLSLPIRHCGSRDRNWVVRFLLMDRTKNSASTPGIVRFHVRNGDIVRPQVTATGGHSRTGPYVVDFTEDVTGISDASAVVRPAPRHCCSGIPPTGIVAGRWACRTHAGAPVDCASGALRTATWIPAHPLRAGAFYYVDFNPEHVLDVTDLHGFPIELPGAVSFEPSGS